MHFKCISCHGIISIVTIGNSSVYNMGGHSRLRNGVVVEVKKLITVADL